MATKTNRSRGKQKTETPLPADEIPRAAARARLPPHALPAAERIAIEDRTREQITGAIAPGLALACDQLGEEIASIAENGGHGDDYANVADALLTVWRIRWELGLTPKANNDYGTEGREVAS